MPQKCEPISQKDKNMTREERIKAFEQNTIDIIDGIISFNDGSESDLYKKLCDNMHTFKGLKNVYFDTDIMLWVVIDEEKKIYPIPMIEESGDDGKEWWELFIPVYQVYVAQRWEKDGFSPLSNEELIKITQHDPDYEFDIDGEIQLKALRPFELESDNPKFFINNSWGEDNELVIPMSTIVAARVKGDAIVVTLFDKDEEEVKTIEVRISTTVNPKSRL